MSAKIISLPAEGAVLRERGIYVVRHEVEPLYTLGLAGASIADRLKKHAIRYDGPAYSHERHRYHPFTQLVFAVQLAGWQKADIKVAEHAMYAAFATRYSFVAESVFSADRNADFSSSIARLMDDLTAINALRAVTKN